MKGNNMSSCEDWCDNTEPDPVPECPCGKDMYEVEDPVTKMYTGYLWRCDCMQDNWILSIG